MNQPKPSKSERKRQQLELQALGEQLIALDDDLLDQLPLGERMRTAIADVRRMTAREARRRQKQYIGKLMRDVDPVPVRALLDKLRADDRREKRIFANAERWRDRLVSEGRAAILAFADASGAQADDLEALLDELDRAPSDRVERDVRRRIFRSVHAALVAQSADG